MAWLICVKLAVCILMAAFLSLFLWWKLLVFGTFKYILFFILLPHSKYWLCHGSISYQPVIVVAQVQSWVSPCMICDEGSRTGTGFLWVFGWPALVLFQQHSMLINVSLTLEWLTPALQRELYISGIDWMSFNICMNVGILTCCILHLCSLWFSSTSSSILCSVLCQKAVQCSTYSKVT
jgi:hypothetical protein